MMLQGLQASSSPSPSSSPSSPSLSLSRRVHQDSRVFEYPHSNQRIGGLLDAFSAAVSIDRRLARSARESATSVGKRGIWPGSARVRHRLHRREHQFLYPVTACGVATGYVGWTHISTARQPEGSLAPSGRIFATQVEEQPAVPNDVVAEDLGEQARTILHNAEFLCSRGPVPQAGTDPRTRMRAGQTVLRAALLSGFGPFIGGLVPIPEKCPVWTVQEA
uniref:Uncharacterized protein n=1 Tax=Ananas comosus var. bracteatus TaxID=296719 RepID=A0A6V7PLG7_ANACO|nr:unnamed protein product [Ananas comosus var. bracteatus]